VKVYIGYNGADNVRARGVELRYGIALATPADWLKNPIQNRDVCFIQLEKPFTNYALIKYMDTPQKEFKRNLGVVGYPADLEHGEYMYECFQDTDYDLATSRQMLQYTIDTAGGELILYPHMVASANSSR
jgi:V8-like Glu-specific endopeptidase